MSSLAERIAALSPEKQALLTLRLKQRGAKPVTIPRREDAGPPPLSFAQQRLWFLDQFEPGSPLYNIPAAVRLTGPLDVSVLERALDEIARRHDALRTTFTTVGGGPVQLVAPALTLSLPIEDLQHLSSERRNESALAIADQEARKPFDLSKGPLVRARLLRLSEARPGQGREGEHVLLLTMHHIVSDGWSTGVLVRELAALYDAFTHGRPSPLTELPIQYADYAVWQRDWLRGDVLQRQLSYWKEQLRDSPPMLDLPTDRPRPRVQTNQGAEYSFKIPQSVYRSLETLSRQEDATLFMTLLAAFQVLLHRYTHQADMCIGTPVANRNRVETEDLIGFFVNTLVMRADLSGEPSFRELLARVRDIALAAYDYQDLPFEMLVEKLQPDRDMSRSPLFQVMFDLETLPTEAFKLPSVTVELLDVERGTAKFDLMLSVLDHPAEFGGRIEYNTDLFDAATIQRMAGHFRTLLEGIVADPDQTIATLPLLSTPEICQLLTSWNDSAVDYPQHQCVHQEFESQVERTPEVTAVVFGEDRLSYRELNQRANQLAHTLQALKVGPDTLVGLSVERSVEMIVGLLGILKAGAAYLPLDPAYPEERLTFMIEDAQVAMILTQEQQLGRFSAFSTPYAPVCLDADWSVIAQESVENPTSPVTPENAAYVIYTSGSTGRPKGVMIQHRSALHLATALHRHIYAPHSGDHLRLSLNAPLAFDASVQQIVMLLFGHTLYIIPQEARQDGDALLAYIRANRLQQLDCVPSQLKLLLEAGLLDGSGWMPSILMPGGEAIDEITWQKLAAVSDVEVYNMYGPTECAVDSTIGRVKMTSEQPTIGRPVANARLYVLDRRLQPVPVGVAGELCIGGAGVGQGYLNRPKLTAEQFIPDPFNDEVGARLYRTGDLVRYRPDGNVEFLGRIDYQVKVRGFRIELGEIENVLKEHPQVRDTVAVVREVTPGDKRLVGYVVPEDGATPTVDALRDFLKEKLPEYMVPSLYVALAALPLTPNAKVDRQALPAPDGARPDLEKPYVAPRTELERFLVDRWQEILKIEQIGVHDNFFALGGDSIRAAVLVNRLQEMLAEAVEVKAVFLAPTVAELADHLRTHQPDAVADLTSAGTDQKRLPDLHPIPRDGDLPLSFAQQRLWFLDHLEPESAFYNVAGAVRLTGTLNTTALERSLNEVVRRHETLRTTFQTRDGKSALTIAPELKVPLPVVDLADLPQASREHEALRRATAEARRPFDLAAEPLLRAILFRLSEARPEQDQDGEYIVLLVMHHIVSDGWSVAVLIQEVATLYDAVVKGRPSPLPDLPIQYVDYAHWQRQWLQGDGLEEQLNYWREQLAGLPPVLELPTDRPRSAVQTSQGAIYQFELPHRLSEQIKRLIDATEATLFMTLLAAFQVLLHRYSSQDDISVGVPIANRNRKDLERLIGFFVNTLVLRTDFSDEPSFRQLVKRVREVTLGAYAHQDVPFEMVVDAVQPQRSLSHSPLFQVMFAFQNAPMEAVELPGLTMTPMAIDSGTAKFDLALSMAEGEEGLLHGSLEYNTDLFDAATIRRMMRHFREALKGIVAHPDRPVSELRLLTEKEQRRQVVRWNDTAAPSYPHDRCAHELFEVQAEQTPDAIALAFSSATSGLREDRTLTYGELNRRANQLAHHLQGLGVGPETPVGICVERSLEMMVAVMGVLKAGGTYVPLDPTYPQDRLIFMMEDAGVSIVLTQAHVLDDLDFNLGSKTGDDMGNTRAGRGPRHVLCLDSDWETIARESDATPSSNVTPDNLAYVIYTSGSTGRPKGTLLEHRGLCDLAMAYVQDFDIGAESQVLQFFSFSFDGSVADSFTAFISGATLWMADQNDLLPGPGLAQLLGDWAITWTVMPPSALSVLPAEPLPALQTLISGGEACTREIVDRWSAGRRFINAYGPTEATVAASWFSVEDLGDDATNIPIGRPMANTKLHVLDRHLQPTPIGVAGELHIGGTGVARGYLGRPRMTAASFIPDPFSDRPGARLYKTGDLVRCRPDGNVEFLGRIDHQVKVRGFRIELGEIEATLESHPSLRKAVVLARGDISGDKRLVGYVVPEGAVAPSITELRGFLKERLPEYMVPSVLVTLESLPLTPVGKVDRRALPAPDQTRPELESAYVAPRDRREEILVDIWAGILGVERIGVHDNFFELGGDSILAIQLAARANQAGLQLNPRQLFQHPTVAGLASVAGRGPEVQAEQGPVMGPVPLTPIQHWFFEQGLPELDHWNQAMLLEVKERLDPVLLEQAVDQLLAHHDALRLRFERWDGGWRQVNAGIGEEVPFEWADLSGLREAEQGLALGARASQLQASLDLTEGPLMRVGYFDLGEGRPGRLLMAVHHLAIDGVSWRILLEDLQTAYEQLERGDEVSLAPKTTSFRQWAMQLEEYAQTEEARKELGYWLATSDSGAMHLPADSPHGPNTEATARTVSGGLNEEETQALLQEVPTAYGTEINDVLLAALVEAFAEWTGRRQLHVALEGHGREDLFDGVDLSRTVGWFTTIYPVALDLEEAEGPGEVLKTVKEQLRAVPRRGFGYGVLRYLTQDESVAAHLEALPLPQVSFNYLGQFDHVLDETSPFGLAPESPGPSRSPEGQRPHLLSLNGGISDGQLQMEWTYSETVHRRETIRRVAECFIEALRAIIAHCRSPEAKGYTPSDFPDVQLSPEDIEALMLEVGEPV